MVILETTNVDSDVDVDISELATMVTQIDPDTAVTADDLLNADNMVMVAEPLTDTEILTLVRPPGSDSDDDDQEPVVHVEEEEAEPPSYNETVIALRVVERFLECQKDDIFAPSRKEVNRLQQIMDIHKTKIMRQSTIDEYFL